MFCNVQPHLCIVLSQKSQTFCNTTEDSVNHRFLKKIPWLSMTTSQIFSDSDFPWLSMTFPQHAENDVFPRLSKAVGIL